MISHWTFERALTSRAARVTLAALLLAAVGASQAGVVKIFHNNGVSGDAAVEAFYNNNGHTATRDTGAITAAALAGVDLLIGWERTAAYSAAEVAAMSAFLDGGGRIAFFGENDLFDTENNNINAALAALGSALAIDTAGDNFFDEGFHIASGPQIPGHPLNTGVAAFEYAAPNDIGGVLGGDALFLSQDLAIIWAAFDSAAAGDGIVVMTDSNVTNFGADVDNSRWFLNLLEVGTAAAPAPGVLALLGVGLIAMGVRRTRAAG